MFAPAQKNFSPAPVMTMTCTASADPDLAGYIMFYSTTSGFDPTTSGGVLSAGIPSITVYGLAAS